jgi:nitroreductase
MILLFKDKRGVADPGLGVGIAGQNMVLAAQSLGLCTCWIGFVRLLTWSKRWPQWKKRFVLEYPYELSEAIVLGYPQKREFRAVPREVQLVAWLDGGLDDKARIERQGE